MSIQILISIQIWIENERINENTGIFAPLTCSWGPRYSLSLSVAASKDALKFSLFLSLSSLITLILDFNPMPPPEKEDLKYVLAVSDIKALWEEFFLSLSSRRCKTYSITIVDKKNNRIMFINQNLMWRGNTYCIRLCRFDSIQCLPTANNLIYKLLCPIWCWDRNTQKVKKLMINQSFEFKWDKINSKERKNKTKQNKTKQNKTKQNKTKQNKTKQYNTIQCNTINYQ